MSAGKQTHATKLQRKRRAVVKKALSALVAVSLAIMMGTPMTAFANEATNTTNPNTNANTTNNTTNNNTTTDNNSAALSENLPLAKPSIWAIPETSL
ncbi:MAG: hypothetical protein LBB35_01720, partial [Coriobacteriaceae bacterium]|nr:hypothetical protein [Coriobacteriaceae bacterium]